MAASSSLAELRLGGNSIGDEGAKALAAGMAAWLPADPCGNSRPRQQQHRRRGCEGRSKALEAGVAASGSLTTLSFYDNNFGDEGAKALVTGVAASGSLSVLHLDGNNQVM